MRRDYLINCNKTRDASSIFWISENYIIHDLEPYIYCIQCDDGQDYHDLINNEWPDAEGKDDFKNIKIDNFEAIPGDVENQFYLCFTALVNVNLNQHPKFSEALNKSNNLIVPRVQFKHSGKPILDKEGYEEFLFDMDQDVFVEFQINHI